MMEAALTTIQDCEDAVAAVDAKDKTKAYRNWLGLMKGTLDATYSNNGSVFKRKLNSDISFIDPEEKEFTLPGRNLMLI
jgi:malate synthase